MKKKNILLIVIFVCLLFLYSCSCSGNSKNDSGTSNYPNINNGENSGSSESGTGNGSGSGSTPVNPDEQEPEVGNLDKSCEKVAKVLYNPALDSGYDMSNQVENTVFNSNNYTTLAVYSKSGEITKSQINNTMAFGIVGEDISLRFSVNYYSVNESHLNNSDWMLTNDSWGEKEGQKVNGVVTGKVSSGALVIQTSYDGHTWSNENKGKYTEGLYTTDYYNHYGNSGITIYTPSGDDVSRGIYIRVLYAYEVYKKVPCEHKNSGWNQFWGAPEYEHEYDCEYKNYLETYTLYICNNDPEVVTFHNLSLDDNVKESVSDEDLIITELYKKTETLINDSLTTTGFKIDCSLNKAAKITVKRNNDLVTNPVSYEFYENGKYDISVETVLGVKKNLTIYINNKTSQELYEEYFNSNFLIGKRIYSKDLYPTYEGGLVLYNIAASKTNVPLLRGKITNLTTGNVLEIMQGDINISGNINDAGEYEAEFYTNSTFDSEHPAGDNQIIKFRFKIIPFGSSPGPQINKESLQNFSYINNPTNLYPIYYGVSFQSAHKGNITIAFASKDAAIEYAYNYEKGMVELQEDGSYRYNGSLIVSQKTKYGSAWELTDAVYYFAEQAVQKLYFDLSDQFTYLTLEDSVLETITNLRTLELEKSIVIFADNTQKELLMNFESLPIINSKKYAYLVPGIEGEVVAGLNDFIFIKDKNGYDTNSVVIIDSANNRYSIEYNISVEEQLKKFGAKSGIITIEEKNIYNEVTTYQAIYLESDVITTSLELKCYENGEETIKYVNSSHNNENYILNAFSLSNIKDDLDPYGIVIIKGDGFVDFYSYTDDFSKIYIEKGNYLITVLNRLGHSYSFSIKIEEKVIYSLELNNINIVFNSFDETVSLPEQIKYGYDFIGYKADNGDIYLGNVETGLLKDITLIELVWAPKKFNLILEYEDHNEKSEIIFGETYTLPIIESSSEKKFLGWFDSNGNEVKSFKVDVEKNYQFTAKFKTLINEKENVSDNKILKIFSVLSIFIGIILLLLNLYKMINYGLDDSLNKLGLFIGILILIFGIISLLFFV